jgi:putative transcriptional regulator
MSEEKKIWSYEWEKDKPLQAGQVLLSEPFMWDENFRRTVALICRHNHEEGTTAQILNRPIKIKLQDIVDNFPPDFPATLNLGGPVGTDLIQILHSLGSKLEGSEELCKGVYWGGNFEQLKKLIRNGEISPQHVRFYVGYSGWSEGQLLQEMKDDSWILAPASHSLVFNEKPETVWKNTMTGMGGIYETMAKYPENPILN